MKKYILILGLFVTSLAFSQGGYTRPPVTATAINVTIADAGAIITATEVENALQENRTAINLNTAKDTNVSTDLTITHNVSTVVVNSSDGTNGTINAATITEAGVLTASSQIIAGLKTFTSSVTANAFIKAGGSSTEFLKANGSLSTGISKSDLVVALRGKVALGDVSGTVNIDTSLGIHFTMNMTGNITSLTFSNLTNEELKTISLEITGDAGGYTITQPATVKPDNVWSSLDSTLKNQIQIYMFDISTPEFSTTLLKW